MKIEIIIEQGKRIPAITWILFGWKFFMKSLKGFFDIDMALWSYDKEQLTHQLFAKRSYFSNDGAAILVKADNHHVGRSTLYNDRISDFSIEKQHNSWTIMVDQKYIYIDVESVPIMTYNALTKLNSSYEASRQIKINYYESENDI